jgi:hypothetical protein
MWRVWANQAIMLASRRSVFSSMPMDLAKSRTMRGLTMAARTPWAHSKAWTGRSYPPRGFHHREVCAVLAAEFGEFGDALGGVGEAAGRLRGAAQMDVERVRGHIDSTDDGCHGNLPCRCDGLSGDCPVVRDDAAPRRALPIGCYLRGNRAAAPREGAGGHRPPRSAIPSHQRRQFRQIQGAKPILSLIVARMKLCGQSPAAFLRW